MHRGGRLARRSEDAVLVVRPPVRNYMPTHGIQDDAFPCTRLADNLVQLQVAGREQIGSPDSSPNLCTSVALEAQCIQDGTRRLALPLIHRFSERHVEPMVGCTCSQCLSNRQTARRVRCRQQPIHHLHSIRRQGRQRRFPATSARIRFASCSSVGMYEG